MLVALAIRVHTGLEYLSQGISVAINDDVLPGNLDLLLGSYLGFLVYMAVRLSIITFY
jgi:hypothetical protein